jgi:hypothetical protein
VRTEPDTVPAPLPADGYVEIVRKRPVNPG